MDKLRLLLLNLGFLALQVARIGGDAGWKASAWLMPRQQQQRRTVAANTARRAPRRRPSWRRIRSVIVDRPARNINSSAALSLALLVYCKNDESQPPEQKKARQYSIRCPMASVAVVPVACSDDDGPVLICDLFTEMKR